MSTPTTTPKSTLMPTSEPQVTPGPEGSKVVVKFKKKVYNVKKGKKVTVKITLKKAKKATFSVDKKGKKTTCKVKVK